MRFLSESLRVAEPQTRRARVRGAPLTRDLSFPPTVGPVSVSFSPVPSLAEIVERNPRVEAGGRYRPAGCEPRSRTAVIVPHRGREHHLRLLLYHLHPFLQRQQLAYGIYVIHQVHSHSDLSVGSLRPVPLHSPVVPGITEGLAAEGGEILALLCLWSVPYCSLFDAGCSWSYTLPGLFLCSIWNCAHLELDRFGLKL